MSDDGHTIPISGYGYAPCPQHAKRVLDLPSVEVGWREADDCPACSTWGDPADAYEELAMSDYDALVEKAARAIQQGKPDHFTCHCVGVAMGSYANQVGMRTPDGEWVCIDTCLATEIGRLWHLGVKTLNSCCGHQEVPPSVIVAPESHDLMDRLAYQWTTAPSGLRAYQIANDKTSKE